MPLAWLELVAGPSAVAVDMESPDVRAERDRVASMISLENECIVIKDLRKVYPPQVGPGMRISVLFGPAHMQQCDAMSALLPSIIHSISEYLAPLWRSLAQWLSSCYRKSIHFAVRMGREVGSRLSKKLEPYDMQYQ